MTRPSELDKRRPDRRPAVVRMAAWRGVDGEADEVMMQSGWYMASTSNIEPKYRETIGHIEGLANIRPAGLDACTVWCLDNSVFTGKFQVGKWLQQIERLEQWYSKCAFITIPDVVGDFEKTLSQFHQYRKYVADGLPVALVSQDGIRDCWREIPWDQFDCLFIGGSNEHKLGAEGRWAIGEAKRYGKWVHIGRVNSEDRIDKFYMADSWDGTTTSFAPSNVRRIHRAVLKAREKKKQQKGLFDDLHTDVPSGNYFSQSV